jgi:hypothetical protein
LSGPLALQNRVEKITELIWEHCQGTEHQREDDGWTDYDDALPILFTTLLTVQKHGPNGPCWMRAGRGTPLLPLLQALDNPHTREEFDQRQEQRDHARRAAEAENAARGRRGGGRLRSGRARNGSPGGRGK